MFTSTSAAKIISGTLTPFLYPCLESTAACRASWPISQRHSKLFKHSKNYSSSTTATSQSEGNAPESDIDVNQYDHLNPQPPDYSSTPFADSCSLTLAAGAGGHGCISFLREKYIINGPPNGGDGGTGGNIYIQAVRGETSLHKIARRRIVKAGRGKNGQGDARGGKRGDDVVIVVPVGTVIRETGRVDTVADELARRDRSGIGFGRDALDDNPDEDSVDQTHKWRRDKWLLYPGALPQSFTSADFPALPRPRRSNLALTAPPGPIQLDLDRPMTAPLLLAAGATGGLGNTHFVTKSITRPKFATKGDEGVRIDLQLELKLLADVGLVGLPNAGKSTLLRALTSSRARVGSWAFTTLSPNIGTVVLDSSSGPAAQARQLLDPVSGDLRTHFTIADIPGLIEDAHLDRGLGLGFLRHIERAGVLAFVVDLAAADAVQALKGLWRELGQYERLRNGEPEQMEDEAETGAEMETGQTTYQPFSSASSTSMEPNSLHDTPLPPLSLPPITSKAWFVVATKADLPETQDNFVRLREYLARVQDGSEVHPSGKSGAWTDRLHAVPVCAMQTENTSGVLDVMLSLLERK